MTEENISTDFRLRKLDEEIFPRINKTKAKPIRSIKKCIWL